MDKMELEWVSDIRENSALRGIVFRFWEQEFGDELADGERGWQRYEYLLGIVQTAGKPEIVKEFQQRFTSMLDQEMLRQKVIGAFAEGMINAKPTPERVRKFFEDVRKNSKLR